MAQDENEQAGYEDEEQDGGVFRWMSAFVVLLAVAGFFGLAWYAYKSGGEVVDEKDVELVKADTAPVKEVPANPGGMQIPNQDKTVYGLVEGNHNEKPTVERILPAPEEPVAQAPTTETWMSDKAKNKANGNNEPDKTATADSAVPAPVTEEPIKKEEPVKKTEQFNPAKHEDDSAKAPAEKQVADATPVPEPVKPVETKPVAEDAPPAVAAPKSTKQKAAAAAVIAPITKPVTGPESQAGVPSIEEKAPMVAAKEPPPVLPIPPSVPPVVVTPKVVAKVATKAPAVAAKGPRVQLGAYKSQAEADSNWNKFAKKFSDDVEGKTHYVVRADLGDKGVYYRLQAAGFDSTKSAEEFCFTIVSAGQGCFVAKAK